MKLKFDPIEEPAVTFRGAGGDQNAKDRDQIWQSSYLPPREPCFKWRACTAKKVFFFWDTLMYRASMLQTLQIGWQRSYRDETWQYALYDDTQSLSQISSF